MPVHVFGWWRWDSCTGLHAHHRYHLADKLGIMPGRAEGKLGALLIPPTMFGLCVAQLSYG